MVERTAELMEFTMVQEDNCIDFESWERDWREALAMKFWDHERTVTLRGQCNRPMPENETSGSPEAENAEVDITPFME